MSSMAASSNLLSSNKALKDPMCGSRASIRAGKAEWSRGGFRKIFSRRKVSKSQLHFVDVAEGAAMVRYVHTKLMNYMSKVEDSVFQAGVRHVHGTGIWIDRSTTDTIRR